MASSTSFNPLDWTVLAVYVAGSVGIGLTFYRRNRSAEQFTAAGRSLPGWLCGLSIFATYLSSITFLALPGKAFAANWNAFVFSLALPPAAWIAVRVFLPRYRGSGEVSAYAFLETRFGLWARLAASVFYLVYQIARIGVVLYLMALPMTVLFGWDIRGVIAVTGVLVTVYALVGGIRAVIWADALQACVLLGGALLALTLLLHDLPGGVGEVLHSGAVAGKFSLGSTSLTNLSQPTVWVVLTFGLFENLKNFGIDQSYVQRYIAARSDREAAKSLWLGALLYVPVSALFLFIGTSLHVYYESHPGDHDSVRRVVARQDLLQTGLAPGDADYEAHLHARAEALSAADLGDSVFPHFIATHLPRGLRGLLIAAVFAAAMSTVSTSLNSSATLVMTDLYRRLLRPDAGDRPCLRVLRSGTVVWGVLGTGLALILVRLTDSALDVWWTCSGVLGAGITGLFLLGVGVPRARGRGVCLGLVLGLLTIAWMALSRSPLWPAAWRSLASPLHPYLTVAVGPCVIVGTGWLATLLRRHP